MKIIKIICQGFILLFSNLVLSQNSQIWKGYITEIDSIQPYFIIYARDTLSEKVILIPRIEQKIILDTSRYEKVQSNKTYFFEIEPLYKILLNKDSSEYLILPESRFYYGNKYIGSAFDQPYEAKIFISLFILKKIELK